MLEVIPVFFMNAIIIMLVFVIFVIAFIAMIINITKQKNVDIKRKAEQEKIKSSINPKRFRLNDILFIELRWRGILPNTRVMYRVLGFIIEDISNSKLYFAHSENFYTDCNLSWYQVMSEVKVIIKKANGDIVKVGDEGFYYLTDVIDNNMIVEDNVVSLNKKKYIYSGVLKDNRKLEPERKGYKILNINENNNIDIINKTTHFKGLIEFDMTTQIGKT